MSDGIGGGGPAGVAVGAQSQTAAGTGGVGPTWDAAAPTWDSGMATWDGGGTGTGGAVSVSGSGSSGQTQCSLAVAVSVGPENYVGANGQPIAYWNPELPFLNIFKQAGSNSPNCGWFTSKGFTLDTGEQPWLSMDADGYVTSMTAVAGHTQTFDRVSTFMNMGSLRAGCSSTYPPGSYTLQFQGAGTIVLARDVTSGSLATSTPGVTVAGLTITSSIAAGVTASVTFDVVPTSGALSGVQLTILHTDPSAVGNYLKAISIVQTALMADYLAGQMFHPLFKAALGKHANFRGMKWLGTEGADWIIKFAPLTSGLAKSATTGNIYTVGPAWSGVNWLLPSGTYKFVFATGQVIPVNCTAGSPALHWAPPLSGAIASSNAQDGISSGQAFCPLIQSWETRPAATNAFYSTLRGVPYEVLLQLGNEADIDPWLCIPGVTHIVDPTFAGKLAQLCRTGAGTTLPGFTGLKASQKAYIEFSNEVWNGQYLVHNFSQMMGNLQFPLQGNAGYRGWEWIGVQVAGIGDAFYAAYGSELASGGVIGPSSRAVVSMSGFYTNPDFLVHTMNTPDWTSAAYTHHIGAYHTAPYFPSNAVGVSAPDINNILNCAVPLDTFFDLMYTNVAGGVTYGSIDPKGFLGGAIDDVISQAVAIAGQPWCAYPHLGYEGGAGWQPSNSNTKATLTTAQLNAWIALCASAARDVRMGYVYYDPTHQLSVNAGFLPAMKAAGYRFIDLFQLIWAANATGIWGEFESVMQVSESDGITLVPKASWPEKAKAIDEYING